MQSMIDEMQSALGMAGGSAGFTALLLTGLVALWYEKYEKKTELGVLFWYALITLIVVINPVTIHVVMRYMPGLYNSNVYLWIIPTVPVILYSAGKAGSSLETLHKRVFFVIGMGAIVLLAATTSYSMVKVNMAEEQYIQSDKKDILQYIDENLQRHEYEYCLIWAEDAVMEHARLTNGRIRTLYGKDMWQCVGAVSDNSAYDTELREAYEYMQDAPLHQEEISEIAKKYGCNYIIISEESFEKDGVAIPEVLGAYYLEYSDNTYLMYTYIHYSVPTSEEENTDK